MAGTKAGAAAAALTIKKRYGANFYSSIGEVGGKNSNTGGFASEKRDKNGMTGAERAAHYGKVGGSKSKRTKKVTKTDLDLAA